MIVRHAPAAKCARRLAPGEVRRCLARGPVLVGYWIACPACGAVFTYLDSAAGFFEGPWTRSSYELVGEDDTPARSVMVEHPATLSAERSVRCYECARGITIRNSEIEAV